MEDLKERVSQLEILVTELMELIKIQSNVLKQHSDQLESSRSIHKSIMETVAGLVENAKRR